MSPDCLLYGPIIAIAVSVLKRIPFFTRNHKVIVAVVSAIVAIAHVKLGHASPDVQTIARCIAEQFAGAVASFEVAKSAKSVVTG